MGITDDLNYRNKVHNNNNNNGNNDRNIGDIHCKTTIGDIHCKTMKIIITMWYHRIMTSLITIA